ncbi:MAG: phosphoenolpyruvate carboxylase [Candidatus Doudnabacteria bacterium CG10_big_fil_rev_8_21_14_0_10_42_18]|uniref:Phosphoenolpyruvate carboxylase n=1 Tax=Candidatus Doudnabacteria bacterium CG10_big_fil_rev_8_21_14_0_10_42_18 TaxID=1974552 RepID=A0A2H0VAA1_9BACT|nr:MAG: phosphoenolpyruvate carboxylase [Candidatus Doudnabacteria bacterium CG10_big_fil_rev_8_21_14_0_10_42_18]
MKKKTTRHKIPATMATQHPDHAAKPFWHASSFISTAHEAYEAYVCFSELGIDEYKWDWEGKLVDESVLERLVADHWQYFKKHPLGKDKFLTFRLPNPKVQNEFRLGRALMGILSAASLAKQVGLFSPPLFEVILPMTESEKEMLSIQEAFREISSLKHPLYNLGGNGTLKHIEIIPLFEQVNTIINSDKILTRYIELHKIIFGFEPVYIRPYMARSDPALNSGLVPTMMAIKIGLSKYKKLEKQTGIKMYPVVGVGTLPFRGSINPTHIGKFIKEYAGISTTIIQSAFRYDFPKAQVIKAVKKLNKELPKGKAQNINAEDEKQIVKAIKSFENPYRKSIEKLALLINKIAANVSKRRERVLHIGLFGYSRGEGKVKLPRAITFTSSLYSYGIPPEIIGTGRGLKKAMADGSIKIIEKYYINIKHDLTKAGRFVNKQGLMEIAKKNPAFAEIMEDIEGVEQYLGFELGPRTLDEQQHALITTNIQQSLTKNKKVTHLIDQAALLRRSNG